MNMQMRFWEDFRSFDFSFDSHIHIHGLFVVDMDLNNNKYIIVDNFEQEYIKKEALYGRKYALPRAIDATYQRIALLGPPTTVVKICLLAKLLLCNMITITLRPGLDWST